MTINRWKKSASQAGQMICVNKSEAIALIKSLASQIADKSPNGSREEFFAVVNNKYSEYFSIAVHLKEGE